MIHDKPAYSLTETRESPYGLVIHLDSKGEAKGEAVLDDGLSIDGTSLLQHNTMKAWLTIRPGYLCHFLGIEQQAHYLCRWRV